MIHQNNQKTQEIISWEQNSIKETKKMVEIYKREKANGFLSNVEKGKWVVFAKESWNVFDNQMSAIEWGLEKAGGLYCPLVQQIGFENLIDEIPFGL
jgi:hypothetical protein